jgi:hypothetical protein
MDNPFTIKEAAKPSLTASFVANNKAGEHEHNTPNEARGEDNLYPSSQSGRPTPKKS